jgi:hypothetical protein
MATINQPFAQEFSYERSNNLMAIIRKAQCIASQSVIKTLRRPRKGGKKRSQGGVQFPTGGNCAQCA